MEKFNYKKEWDFIFDEMKKIYDENLPEWQRNVLQDVKEILEDYHNETNNNIKVFLRQSFLIARKQYELMTKNRTNRHIPEHLYSEFKKFYNSYKYGEI